MKAHRSGCMYNDYYRNQALGVHQQHGSGFDMPYFSGARYQKGHGLANIFGNIFRGLRAIMPSVFKTVGRHALTTGVNIANDMLDGKNIKEVAGRHALYGLKSAAGEVAPVVVKTIKQSAHDNVNQSGNGRRKRKNQGHHQKHSQYKRQRCKHQRKDIFN
jgi:hypothetical protein